MRAMQGGAFGKRGGERVDGHAERNDDDREGTHGISAGHGDQTTDSTGRSGANVVLVSPGAVDFGASRTTHVP